MRIVSGLLLLLPLLIKAQQAPPVCKAGDAGAPSDCDEQQARLGASQRILDESEPSSTVQPPRPLDATTTSTQEDETCGLWLAPSVLFPDKLNLFTGVQRSTAERLATPDLLIPLLDVNKNEWSPWHEFVWSSDMLTGLLLENRYLSELFIGGLGSMAQCIENEEFLDDDNPERKLHDKDAINVVIEQQAELRDSAGVQRSKDATAGSFTYHYNFGYQTMDELRAGQEIFVPCHADDEEVLEQLSSKQNNDKGKRSVVYQRPLKSLHEKGVCLDHLTIGTSTLPGVGRGAFVKHAVQEGQVVATTPVVHFDRSQLEIVQQSVGNHTMMRTRREHGIQFDNEQVLGQQLLLNYCFGDPDSNVLLLPYAPGVLAINHASEPNARVQWGPDLFFDEPVEYDNNETEYFDFRNKTHHEMLDEEGGSRLLLEFVALRDIAEGEEIFIDYGDAWATAWEQHEKTYFDSLNETDKNHVESFEYNRLHVDEPFRTDDEQETEPYPDNLQTVCFFMDMQNEVRTAQSLLHPSLEWKLDYLNCMRPCRITKRYAAEPGDDKDEEGLDVELYYDAVVYNMESVQQPEWCGNMPKEGFLVTKLPDYAVDLADKPYTSDVHLKQAFRHEIGVPSDMYPAGWKKDDPKPDGDFLGSPLKSGQMEVIRWAEDGEVVTPHAYRLGLNPRVTGAMLEYCNKMGITDTFRFLTVGGNAFEPGQDALVPVRGNQWFLQRPEPQWRSNLQWFSPGDEGSQQDYLQMLSAAGFDDILASIGEQMGFDGLVAYHLTFMAVSHSIQGYLHYDVTGTGASAFNIIIPLILANETGPELDLHEATLEEEKDDDELRMGRYRYEPNVASMMGDDAYHATSAVDYRSSKEFRMAATVYIADVNEDNVENIMNDYTQHYPPADEELLLSWAGMHWKKDDPTVKLPTPTKDHILYRGESTATS